MCSDRCRLWNTLLWWRKRSGLTDADRLPVDDVVDTSTFRRNHSAAHQLEPSNCHLSLDSFCSARTGRSSRPRIPVFLACDAIIIRPTTSIVNLPQPCKAAQYLGFLWTAGVWNKYYKGICGMQCWVAGLEADTRG